MDDLCAGAEFLLVRLPELILRKRRQAHRHSLLPVAHSAVQHALAAGRVEDHDAGFVVDLLNVPFFYAAARHDIDPVVRFFKKLNPSIIFLTYGINDVGIGYWPTPEDYVNEINNTLALLKEHLPNATVYVCSIIPALEPAFKRGPAWREIPDYNDAVRAFCEENGTPYVDITQLCEEHTDLYQDDGVHLLGGFYPLWGTELIAEVYDYVFALESNESAAE